MRADVIVVDRFYEDPQAVREWALQQRYYYPYESNEEVTSGRKRFSWMTSWFQPADQCPFKSSAELIRTLERITGEAIDLEHWRLNFPTNADGRPLRPSGPASCLWNCSFHFKPQTGQEVGAGVHNHATDGWNGVGPNGWAGLIYLNENAPLRGGLRLWRNRDPKKNYDWMTPKENWELIDDFGNLFNRLILCRGDLPHSGAAGWHHELEHGRLYQTLFFRTKEPAVRPNIKVALKLRKRQSA